MHEMKFLPNNSTDYTLFSVFYSDLPSIGDCCTVSAYSTAKPACLIDLHYKLVTPSAQVTFKVIYSYIVVQRFRFHISGVFLALFVRCQ